ncbi:DUF6254 family protein [Pontibacillus litoralis]|uniref:Uncharacterized protein n=1 Tax=Pontibacillus litoralis JSM 072002 TaxID=1385512 RepID=A0A0A5HTE5_9BACI|nr:DUF6254 family protein [Pontibacillus litoralis]KGX86897.1 hypothetical protein N784_03320 [Pontibacillus litoralis JSM 072002]
MSTQKRRQERIERQRKEQQNPHGKVKSLEQLTEEHNKK